MIFHFLSFSFFLKVLAQHHLTTVSNKKKALHQSVFDPHGKRCHLPLSDIPDYFTTDFFFNMADRESGSGRGYNMLHSVK